MRTHIAVIQLSSVKRMFHLLLLVCNITKYNGNTLFEESVFGQGEGVLMPGFHCIELTSFTLVPILLLCE